MLTQLMVGGTEN